MSEGKYKIEFEELCRHSKLGELMAPPISVSGGLLHRMYFIKTTIGKFAVKLLNPNIMSRQSAMQNYINSERIATLLARIIPALPARKANGKTVQKVNGQFYLIFDWLDGKNLDRLEIKPSHSRIIGEILAEIHQTNFSELEIVMDTANHKLLTDWDYYLQKGRAESTEWSELLSENLDILKEWDSQAAEASVYVSSNMVISHRDLDSKNVLWNEHKPILIDWESAGFIHPMLDLMESAIYWSVDENGEIDQQKFFSFLMGYKEREGKLDADWHSVLAAGFTGKLGWLEYSMKRSLWIECKDAEEQKLGTAEVAITIHEIKNYADQIPKLLHWLNSK